MNGAIIPHERNLLTARRLGDLHGSRVELGRGIRCIADGCGLVSPVELAPWLIQATIF